MDTPFTNFSILSYNYVTAFISALFSIGKGALQFLVNKIKIDKSFGENYQSRARSSDPGGLFFWLGVYQRREIVAFVFQCNEDSQSKIIRSLQLDCNAAFELIICC